MKNPIDSLVLATSLITAVIVAAGCATEKTDTIPVQSAPGVATTNAANTTPRERTPAAQATMSPQDALAKLRAGNARFAAGQSRARNLPAEVRTTAGGQYPFAVIVSCLDSRAPVELLFDQGIGDLFNARIAGNVLNDDILGSLEFACKASGAKLIVVLGHSNCGAVKGAIDNVELGKLTGLLDKIKPAIAQVPDSVQPRTAKNDDFVQKVADANVRLIMQQIRDQSPILREMLDGGKIGLEGGMYDLASGQVHLWP
jgi:carbonic anhydrase